jgi:hypothetical protein
MNHKCLLYTDQYLFTEDVYIKFHDLTKSQKNY